MVTAGKGGHWLIALDADGRKLTKKQGERPCRMQTIST
jgi:hypothetical protein